MHGPISFMSHPSTNLPFISVSCQFVGLLSFPMLQFTFKYLRCFLTQSNSPCHPGYWFMQISSNQRIITSNSWTCQLWAMFPISWNWCNYINISWCLKFIGVRIENSIWNLIKLKPKIQLFILSNHYDFLYNISLKVNPKINLVNLKKKQIL